MERKKLELELNKPTNIEMLFDNPKIGESQYGMYYLYAVRNGDGATEYSFFAPEEVHLKLSSLVRGDTAIITKQAVQKGSKVVTSYEVELAPKPARGRASKPTPIESGKKESDNQNTYLQAMILSFEDALVIQEKFNGMANVNQIAITLFIQRKKVGGY
jgi:hypothetical protein